MIQLLFWAVIAAFIGGCVVCLQLGYHWGRQDHPAPQPAGTDPYAEDTEAERDRWAEQLEMWLAEDAAAEPVPLERLVSTGELRQLYERPYPVARLAGTGELQVLALNGEHEEIAAQVAEFKKEVDQA